MKCERSKYARSDGGMTFFDIASELGISENDARDAYWSAIRKLRTRLPNSVRYLHVLADSLAQERRIATKGAA